jgi:hypothetical protein
MGWTAAALAACGGSGGERSADVTFPKGDVKFLKGTALEGPTKSAGRWRSMHRRA